VTRHIALLAALFTATLSAQYSGLSSTADGSSLYFATVLKLKNSTQPRNGKIFVAAQDAVTLFRARERVAPPPNSPPCTVGGFSDYIGAETFAGGIALAYTGTGPGGCSYPPNPLRTQIVTAKSEIDLAGVTRVSAGGRYAITFFATTARPYSPYTISFLDLQTNTTTPVNFSGPQFPEEISVSGSGRVIANDGTAILGITDHSRKAYGYVFKPGGALTLFPIADGMPLTISADASKVIYSSLQGGYYLADLRTLQSTLLIPAGQQAYLLGTSDDARRLLYIGGGQAHALDTTTLVDRVLTSDPANITAAAISGDGRFVHAVTGRGRILKIDVDAGTQVELVGHTPYLNPYAPPLTPGLTATLAGSGLSDTVIEGTVPLNAWLGNLTMWIGERKIPVIRVEPNSVSFLVPWDIKVEGSTVRLQAEVPGEHTPFYYPEVETALYAEPFPRAGAIARQDWTPTYVGPINTGEIIHVFAIGFGPVTPEVPEGAAAPAAEPYPRTQPLTCSNAEVLYSGIAPYAVERIYQIDLRIGPAPGYQQFICTLGSGTPFAFLTLNIVP